MSGGITRAESKRALGAIILGSFFLLAGCGSTEGGRNAARAPGNMFTIAVDNPYQLQSGPDPQDLDVTTEIIAQRFTSNSTPTRITLVTLRVSRTTPDATSPREVVLDLHASANGMPGAKIAGLGSRTIDGGFEGVRSVSISSSPVLSPSREYFIVVSPGDGGGSLGIQSAVNTPMSNVEPTPEFEAYQSPSGDQGSWLPVGTGRNLVMTVVVDAAAPAPASTTTAVVPQVSTTVSAGGQVQTSTSLVPGRIDNVTTSTGSPSAPTTAAEEMGGAAAVSTTLASSGSAVPTPDDSSSTSTATTDVAPSESSVPVTTTATVDDAEPSGDAGSGVSGGGPATGTVYTPADDPATTRDIAVTLAAFAALLATGAAGMVGTGSAGGAGGGSRARLSTLATKKLKSTGTSRAGRGDAGPLWRRRGTDRVDATFATVPARVGPYSAVGSRILVDGSWARAMFGSSSLLFWPVALATGAAWGLDVGDQLGLPTAWIFVVALVLGVFDSFAGGLVALALSVVASSTGAVDGWSDVRTLLGVWVLLLSPPLIGNVVRPLRRVVHDAETGLRERVFDYVMAPVGVAFAIEAMTRALNGLSGTVIAGSGDFTLVKATVWTAMIARLALEDTSVHLFPERSRTVQPPSIPGQTKTWGAVSAGLRFTVYLFVAEPFFGLGASTVVAGVLLVVPFAMKPWEDDIPNSPVLWRWLPRGFLRFAVLVLAGGWLAVVLLGDSPTADTVRAMTPWLFVPSAFFGVAEYFGRSGAPWPDSRVKRWGGAALWLFVVLVLGGVIEPF